jgi:hypothetical protein
MMSESTTIEQRLAQVEKEIADLRNDIKSLKPSGKWIDAISGTFKDDPEFDEVLRLGKEIRDADKAADE